MSNDDNYECYGEISNYARLQMLPPLELQTVLLGSLTMALMLSAYTTLRSGIRPFTARVQKRISRLIASLLLYAIFVSHWVLSLRRTSVLLSWNGHGGGLEPTLLQPNLGPIIMECGLFGAFSTIIVLAVYVFTRKNLRVRSQQAMIAVALIMYAVSLTHLAIQMPFLTGPGTSSSGIVNAPLALLSVNVIFSDAVVLWRMCVLCKQHIAARTLAVVLLVPTIALSIENLVKNVEEVDSGGPGFSFVESGFSDYGCGIALLGMSLATNFFATIIVAWRTWRYRRDIRMLLATFSRQSIVEKVMTLLVESGSIYCIIWALYIVDNVKADFEFTVDPFAAYYLVGTKAVWFGRLMAQLTGIYPTIILVLVALEQSFLEHALSQSKLSAFVVARPATQPPSGSRAPSGRVSRSIRQYGSQVHYVDVRASFDDMDGAERPVASVQTAHTDRGRRSQTDLRATGAELDRLLSVRVEQQKEAYPSDYRPSTSLSQDSTPDDVSPDTGLVQSTPVFAIAPTTDMLVAPLPQEVAPRLPTPDFGAAFGANEHHS